MRYFSAFLCFDSCCRCNLSLCGCLLSSSTMLSLYAIYCIILGYFRRVCMRGWRNIEQIDGGGNCHFGRDCYRPTSDEGHHHPALARTHPAVTRATALTYITSAEPPALGRCHLDTDHYHALVP